MPGRILVIDDEPQITRVLRARSRTGLRCAHRQRPRRGPATLPRVVSGPGGDRPDDAYHERRRGLPRHSHRSATPVLVLSVRDHERSKVEALDAGADDYGPSPSASRNCWPACAPHLRRAPERTTAAIETGDFMVDVAAHTITVQGKPIHLTPKNSTCCSTWPATPAR